MRDMLQNDIFFLMKMQYVNVKKIYIYIYDSQFYAKHFD